MRYKGLKGKCWEEIKRITRAKSKDCFTCPSRNLTGQALNAGHYLPVGHTGSNNTLSWDLQQIRSQCARCNGAGQGMQVEFRRGLVREMGEEAVQALEARRYKVDPVKDWNALLAHLKTL